MALGWILGSAVNETAAISEYWDGDEWSETLGDSFFLSESAGVTVELARSTEGEYQQRFTDRDVRLLRAQAVISLVP